MLKPFVALYGMYSVFLLEIATVKRQPLPVDIVAPALTGTIPALVCYTIPQIALWICDSHYLFVVNNQPLTADSATLEYYRVDFQAIC